MSVPHKPNLPILDPSAADEQYHTYRPTEEDVAAAERCIRRDCPDDADTFLAMLGLGS